MSGLLELCRKYFDTDNLYKVLNTNKKCTDKEGIDTMRLHHYSCIIEIYLIIILVLFSS